MLCTSIVLGAWIRLREQSPAAMTSGNMRGPVSDGPSLQEKKFAELFVRDESTRSWVNESDGFGVATARVVSGVSGI